MNRTPLLGSASTQDTIWASLPTISNSLQRKFSFPNEGDAFDLTVDAIVHLLERDISKKPVVNEKGYVYLVGKYTCYRNKQKNARLLPISDNTEHSDDSYHQALSAMRCQIESDNAKWIAARISEELLKLKEVDQKIILLRAEGVRFEEIAIVLQLSHAGVRKRHSRAVERIQNAVMKSE